MRNVIWFAALLVGLLVAGSASAQSFGMVSKSATRTNNKIGLWDTTSYLTSPFRLTNLFGSFHGVLLPGGTRTTPPRIEPSSPNYMSSFGYKKLY